MLFLESKTIKGERKSTYWCMSAVLNSFFFFVFSLVTSYFSFLVFYVLSFSMLTFGLWFFLEIPNTMIFPPLSSPFQCIARGPLYRAFRYWYLLFQPLTAFVQCGCPCRPLISRQLFSHHHFLCQLRRQTKKIILFVCLPWLFYPLQCVCSLSLSLYPSWHALGGSNLSLLLLGGMSSQQDISPKRT